MMIIKRGTASSAAPLLFNYPDGKTLQVEFQICIPTSKFDKHDFKFAPPLLNLGRGYLKFGGGDLKFEKGSVNIANSDFKLDGGICNVERGSVKIATLEFKIEKGIGKIGEEAEKAKNQAFKDSPVAV